MDNLKLSLKLIIVAIALSGCHGQDPFKRQNNPIKDYPRTAEVANEPYVPGRKPVVQGKDDAATKISKEPACVDGLSAKATPDHGNLLLKFTEGVENSYTISVTVGGPTNMDIKLAAEKPENSDLRVISRQGNKQTYRFTWKPARGAKSQTEKFILTNNAPKANNLCPGAKSKIPFNLVVAQSKEAPSVSFPGIKEKITFGEKFDFRIVIDDPSATEGKAPAIQSVKLQASARKTLLDATQAITGCDDPGIVLPDNQFEFTCTFDSNLIKGVEPNLNKGKTVSAGFHVTAVSTATGLASTPTLQRIDVIFEEVAPAPATARAATDQGVEP